MLEKEARQRQRCGQGGILLKQKFAEAKERQRIHGYTAPGRGLTLKEKIPEVIEGNQARDHAAKITGTNSRYVSDAKAIKEKAPELVEDIRKGEITIQEAKKQIKKAGSHVIANLPCQITSTGEAPLWLPTVFPMSRHLLAGRVGVMAATPAPLGPKYSSPPMRPLPGCSSTLDRV